MLRSPKQAARPAGTLAPQAHSCRCVPPPPQGEAAAVDFPDRVAQAAPSRTARLRHGSPPQTTPPPCCTAQSLRQDDSVSAAGRRIERYVQAAAHGLRGFLMLRHLVQDGEIRPDRVLDTVLLEEALGAIQMFAYVCGHPLRLPLRWRKNCQSGAKLVPTMRTIR